MGVRALPCGLDYVLFPFRLFGGDGFSVVLTAYGTPLFKCAEFSGRSLLETFPYSVLVGSTVDTNLRQFTELFRISAQCFVWQWLQFALVDGVLSYFETFRIQRDLVSTVDTCLRQLTRCVVRWCSKLWLSRSCSPSKVVDFPFVEQRQIPMGLSVQQTIVTPQLRVDMVVDFPVVQDVQISLSWCRGIFPWSDKV